MFVERSQASKVKFSLRVQDLSRQSETWGTEIPVVREAEFRTDRIDLIDVPVDPEFRYMLRVYDADTRSEGRVRVRVFALKPEQRIPFEVADNPVPADRPLGETVVNLIPGLPGLEHYPGYAQLNDFSSFAALSGVSRVRLEIEPLAPVTRIWAFVSVTHNETQHVTTVTPN